MRCTLRKGEKALKRRKTSAKQRTLHPVYNEALQFSIVKASLVDLILDFEVDGEGEQIKQLQSLQVMHDAGAFTTARPLAQLTLPLHQYKDIWKAMVHGEHQCQAHWHPLQAPSAPEKAEMSTSK